MTFDLLGLSKTVIPSIVTWELTLWQVDHVKANMVVIGLVWELTSWHYPPKETHKVCCYWIGYLVVYNQQISYVNIVDSGTYMYTGDALHHSYLSQLWSKATLENITLWPSGFKIGDDSRRTLRRDRNQCLELFLAQQVQHISSTVKLYCWVFMKFLRSIRSVRLYLLSNDC